MTFQRLMLIFALPLMLTACGAGQRGLDGPPVPLGDFSLGHNIVVAPKAQRGPLSREASEEQLVNAMTAAIDERFGRYEGPGGYHFGISVEGYVLAKPGVPLILSPKSILILKVTVWDDAKGVKLNETPEQITVLETFGSDSLVGSGYTLSPEDQLKELSQNAARSIERYLKQQMREEGWFQPS